MDNSHGWFDRKAVWSNMAPLTCHADTPCSSVSGLRAAVHWQEGRSLAVKFRIKGTPSRWRLPDPAQCERTDGLWQTTCFELFIGIGDTSRYYEFNLSVSGQWAAYAFESYREGMTPLHLPATPVIGSALFADSLVLKTVLDLNAIELRAVPIRLGLSAVIEEADGQKSCWALRHPPGKPDFHHKDCFALNLAAPEAP